MDDQGSEESGFKVVDKRRFNADGDSREGAEDRVPPKPKASADTQAAAKPDGGEAQTSSSAQSAQEYRAETVDFASFIVSLATQAMMLLGEIPNPETNSLMLNLDAARQTIDILGMLEEKTKGNVSAEEERLMTEVLASLRLAYVTKRRGSY